MTKDDKKQMARELIKAMRKTMQPYLNESPDCTAQQLAVDFQTIIRNAAYQTYLDTEDVLAELQLELDDCLNSGSGGPPP